MHIVNLTEPQFENRYMLQNDLSRLCFGRITKADGGLKNKLIDWTAAWRAMRVFENSFTDKGTAFSTSYKMHFIGPEEGMIKTLERQVWTLCNIEGSLLAYAIQVPSWVAARTGIGSSMSYDTSSDSEDGANE